MDRWFAKVTQEKKKKQKMLTVMLKKLRNLYKWMRKIVLNTDYKSYSMLEIWSEVVLF